MSLHVTTFYSFKGGVGRTQALVNVAAWIAMKQRPESGSRPRVLMVDFDLEASGIQFVEGLKVLDAKPGVVDFIHDYLDHAGEVPDIANYISQAVLPNGVQVDLILAGDQARYHSRFGQLRFDALWQRQHGHDLFLDMRHQLEELGYEFMLIDSRTGLCDTSELCTLTLPDQVVVVFAPNRQNLAGTKLVIERIRQNPTTDVLGVASRVRKTDDEHGALRAIMTDLKKIFQPAVDRELKLSGLWNDHKLVLVVHEDPQQRVLADAVAVASYPRSALAREYRRIARRIVSRNPRSRFWVSTIAHDAPSRERMTRRYGIPSQSIDSWREVAVQTAKSGDAEAMWRLAAAHPADRWGDDEEFRRDPERVRGVDPVCAIWSLAGGDNLCPPAGAIRWVREALEFGELERRFFGSESHPSAFQELLDVSLQRSITGSNLDAKGADAVRVLVWTRGLDEMIGSSALGAALRDPSNYRDGSCFGGFRGCAGTSYIMECGDRAGVDWLHLATSCGLEDVRRWVRTAAIDTYRIDIAAPLLEPTAAERRYLSHWLGWANDVLAIGRGAKRTEAIDAKSAILAYPAMLDQLRTFWLPGVSETDVEFEGDRPVGSVRTTVMGTRGRRPLNGLVLPWVYQPIGGPCTSDIRDLELALEWPTYGNDLRLSYDLLTWISLVPTAARVLRAIGDEGCALDLERDAIARLDRTLGGVADAVRLHGIHARTADSPSSVPEVTNQQRLAADLEAAARQMVHSPIHRSPVNLFGLYAALRDSNATPQDPGVALSIDANKTLRVVYSRVAPLGSPGRRWGGWELLSQSAPVVW